MGSLVFAKLELILGLFEIHKRFDFGLLRILHKMVGLLRFSWGVCLGICLRINMSVSFGILFGVFLLPGSFFGNPSVVCLRVCLVVCFGVSFWVFFGGAWALLENSVGGLVPW